MKKAEQEQSKKPKKAIIITLSAILLAVAAAVIIYWQPLFSLFSNPDHLRTVVQQAGPWGPLLFILLQIAQVVIAPIPGQAVGFVSGFLFGTLWGTVYTMIGSAIGFTLVFVFARKLGRPFVEYFVDKKVLDKFDYLADTNGVFLFFMIFLLPAFPDDLICYIAGLSKIKISTLIIISLLGRLPGNLVLNFTGSGVAEANMQQVIIILTIVMIISAIAFWKRKNLERFVKRLAKNNKKTP